MSSVIRGEVVSFGNIKTEDLIKQIKKAKSLK